MTGDPHLVTTMLETMDSNRKAITQEVGTLTFYMQGGLSFDDAHQLSAEQRKILGKVIEKHYSSMNPQKGGNLIG